MSYFHKHDNENLYEFLSCEIIGAKDGFEPSSYRDISYTIYHWKYFAQYLLSAWCATTNLKAMLTDGFCFPFLLVPQTTLHIGSLCFMANCLLPHLLITGWLLTIYSIAWFIMPFLGLDATHRRKVWLLLKELWTLLSALFFIRVSRVLDFSKCGQVGHEPTGSTIFSS